jgi:glycosyltransferase involved in cell wall biosynthesis
MAASLPVVAARGGGSAEIVEHGRTGLLAAPDDPAALADEITRLARDAAQRHALGSAGRRRAETHYSLEAHTRNILEVYRSAVEHPRLARTLRRDSLT